MNVSKPINPIVKQVLELGPTILFFIIYLRIKEDVFNWNGTEYSGFIVAALIFVPILLISMGILWKLTGKLSRMQVFTAIMVIFFGGLTAWFNDERFFKMKTSIVYGLFALLLGIGLARGQSYLAYVMNEMMPMRQEGWMILTRRLCIAFGGIGCGERICLAYNVHRRMGQNRNFCFSCSLDGFPDVAVYGIAALPYCRRS